ncbi:MAG: right-handed parallel beta-helix repeat-containing protein [Planctomycetes bacterium]|nr:right-handed parallel beta-helix repeat-containing protein [Planctomycetota bacterium]
MLSLPMSRVKNEVLPARRAILFLPVIVLAIASGTQAATHQVPEDFATIQEAIDAAQTGDIVIVAPGTYIETLRFPGRDITLTSTDPLDPEVVATTILSLPVEGGRRTGIQPLRNSVVLFNQGETPASVLTGFTIRDGFGTRVPELEDSQVPLEVYMGGGVLCQDASPTITRNHFRNNIGAVESDSEQGLGGGVACFGSEALIINNIFTENRSSIGGAMITFDSNPLIANNLFVDNSALLVGGVYLRGGRFLNNTLVGNHADQNIGHLLVVPFDEQSSILVQNNIFSQCPAGGGILGGERGPGSWFAYNDVWDNEPMNFIDVSFFEQGTFQPDSRTWVGAFGNISEDPKYMDIENQDFRLRDDSPCVNAGNPDLEIGLMDTDLDGRARLFARRVDMGAYELAMLTGPQADAGRDQDVFTGTRVTLDGSGSVFPDPNNLTRLHLWDQLEGPSAELSDPRSVQPSFDALQEGQYRFELIVYDGTHVSQPDETVVTVTRRTRGGG